MSTAKKKIGLMVTGIHFGRHAITYKVAFKENVKLIESLMQIITAEDIKEKDLILKSTHLNCEKMEVSFVCVNVTTLFYQDVFNKSIKDPLEYESDKQAIYDKGDIIGYVLSTL